MIIRFRRRTQVQILILILFWGPFLLAPLTQVVKAPSVCKYILDLSCIALLIMMLVAVRKGKKIENGAYKFQSWIALFFLITILNYIVNYQSIFYYAWGVRNNFRGYILFLAAIYFLKEQDINELLNILDKLFYVNAAIMLIQFVMLGYKQDNLGGIFGTESGCNAYVNLFFCIIIAITYIQYTEKQKKLRELIVKMLLTLILAAMAELKFFYVEFIVIVLVASIITKFSWKKLIVIFMALIALMVGYRIFLNVFPNIDLSIEGLYEYASSNKGYTSSGDLNRLNFFGTINNEFLGGTWKKIFGLGLGNCDSATGMNIVTTPFSKRFGGLHYNWMSTTFMYLENGVVGLIFLFGFFVLVCIKSIKQIKKNNGNKMFCRIAFVCGVIAIMNCFYNISLRLEAGYMIYILLAIPWCKKDCEMEKK